jgi:hypothetical protein
MSRTVGKFLAAVCVPLLLALLFSSMLAAGALPQQDAPVITQREPPAPTPTAVAPAAPSIGGKVTVPDLSPSPTRVVPSETDLLPRLSDGFGAADLSPPWTHLNALGAWQTILFEGFEDPFPTTGWSVYQFGGGEHLQVWNRTNFRALSGDWSAWPAAGGSNALDPALHNYANNMDTWMAYGPFDLSDATAAQVFFSLWHATEPCCDALVFYVSHDVHVPDEYAQWSGNADWGGPTFDLGRYLGDDTVWILWRFYSDSSVTDAGPFIDDIWLGKYVEPCSSSGAAYTCNMAVSATHEWQPTSLSLHAGAEFTITYRSGDWNVGIYHWPFSGPEGYPPSIDEQINPACKTVTSLPFAMLIGRVGNGAPFAVGSGGIFTADADGLLALRINDEGSCMTDNRGAIVVGLEDPHEYSLVANSDGNGSVIIAPSQPYFRYGDNVLLTAVAGPGWLFQEWQGDLGSSENPLAVTIDRDKFITATFVQEHYTLSLQVSGQGAVSRTPDQATYPSGAQVTLMATPNPGWSFTGWSGDVAGIDNPLTLTLSGNRNIQAGFVPITYTLLVNTTGSGNVTVDPSHPSYTFGEEVTLTPLAASGWSFSGWGGDLSGNANPALLLIDGNKTVNATFTQNQYSLTVNRIGNGTVTRTPNLPSYLHGASVTLTVTPDAGWTFSGWSGGLSGNANPATIILNGSRAVTATFVEQLQPPLPPEVNPITNAGQVSDFAVSWAAAANATGYELQEQHNGGGWNTIHTGAALTLNQTGKADGSWCYRVRATNSAGASGWSAVQCTTVDASPRPQLVLAETVNGAPGGVVALTVSYTAQGQDVSSLLFSIDYDEQRLAFDPTDSDSNCAPDAIQFNAALPASFVKCADFDAADTSGEIDIRIADFSAAPRVLTSGPLLTITFSVRTDAAVDSLAPVSFALASFGSTQGEVNGRTTAGSVRILGAPATIEMSSSSNTLVANGASTAAITARVQDAAGRGVPGYPVTFATTLGTVTPAQTTDGEGRVAAILTSVATVGTATVTSSAGNVQQTLQVHFSGKSISGLVFLDQNGNGTREGDEPGLANVTVTLTPQGGGTSRSTATGADGGYSFADLPAGLYVITITLPAGFTMTTDSQFTITVNATDIAAPVVGMYAPTSFTPQPLYLPLIGR